MDLRDASHEQAVEAIRRAGDTVDFLVQSGQQRSQVLGISKNSQKIAHFIWLRMLCAMSDMHILHCVVLQSLEAPHCFTLNSCNKCKRMVQCVFCWTTPSDVSAVLCVGVCSFTIKCPLDTKHIEQKHLWLKTYLVS